MGAVINIVTIRPEAGEGSLTAGVGDLGFYSGALRYATVAGDGTLSLALEAQSEKGDFSYFNDNGSLNPADDYKAERWNNGFWEESGMIRWSDGSWTISAALERRHRELPLPAPGNDKGKDEDGPWQDVDRRSFSAGKNYSSGVIDWGWSFNRTEEDRDFSDPMDRLGGLGVKKSTYETVRNDFSLFGSSIQGEHFIELTLKGGLEDLDVYGDGVNLLGGLDHFERESFSAVLQDTLPVGDVVLTPLLRWNKIDGESGLSWAIGAEWSWAPQWRLKGTVGSSRRAPNFYETYGDGATIVPNRELNWEEGLHWDLGLRWNGKVWNGDASMGVTLFGMDMDELIEYVQVNERVGSYKNVGEAVVRGVEFETDFKWDRWILGLSWTFMDGENRTPGYRYGKALPNRPENALDMRLTRILSPSLSAFVELQHRGTTFLDMAEQIGLSDLTCWNLGMRWAVGEDRMLVAGIDDIFDEGGDVRQFASGGAGGERVPWYPLEGRTWHVSYVWRF